MELAAWFLTFATAAALIYAVTRALAVALRIAIAVLVVAAVAVGIQAYNRGEKIDKAAAPITRASRSMEKAATSAWSFFKPWWDSATNEPERKPSRSNR